MTTFELYLLLILPEIRSGLLVAVAIIGVSLGILALCSFLNAAEWQGVYRDSPSAQVKGVEWLNRGWRSVGGFLSMLTVFVLFTAIPTQKVMIALIAWELGSSVDGLSELPVDFVEYLQEVISVEMKELTDATEDGK